MLARDGACVIIGDVLKLSGCDAAHLVAHAKGDQVASGPLFRKFSYQTQYIRALTRGRSLGEPQDVIENINDTRNGLLFNKSLQMHWASTSQY